MTNKQIARLFRQVAAAYTIKNESKFRFQIIAYGRAADALENSTEEIGDLFKRGERIILSGIGPAIGAHLEQLLKTGSVKHFDWVMSGIPQAMFPLLEIPTLGPKKAYRLVKEFNLTKSETVVDDLEKIAKQGKIAKLEGFGEKSEQDILQAISEYRQGKGKAARMVLPYAFELAETMI
ncbi:DNA polymerase III, partial [Candidatus Microgenomates bacterium]|nr:DNA polymerase III [Candidatus Microgenomates bacterium]